MYCIYLHRNKINNKVYIGQTKFGDNPNKRWQNGNGYKENISFYYDIQKYGWNNFEHIILENNLTLDESNKLEKQYISYYNSTNPSVGYNTMPGGGKSEKIQGPSDALNSFISLYYNDSNGILKSKRLQNLYKGKSRDIYKKRDKELFIYASSKKEKWYLSTI